MSDIAEFNKEIGHFADVLAPNELVLLQKKVVFDGLARVTSKTRVDTGRARGSHQVTIGALPYGDTDRLDPGGSETIQAGTNALNRLPPFQVVYIGSNLSYIEPLESLDAMYALTLEELRMMFP